jgi:ATPase components of ABC transporters with duplicated ATPase domains
MVLACHNITKAFGEQLIVKDASFHIENREKTALVGINGAGKSTLLKMIMKELALDAGEIIISKGKTIGYLSQHQEFSADNSLYDEVKLAKADIFLLEESIQMLEQELEALSGIELETKLATYHRLREEYEQKNGYACESEIVGILKGLGFTETDFSKIVTTFSGGQKTRVALCKLLLTKPDILLLDEPTNHLDLQSIAWLETYLLNYPGAVLIVSHDRYFLNRVVTKVVEIEQGKLATYLGNYTDYSHKKQHAREAYIKAYLNQQQTIRHQEAVIDKLKSFNREKSIKRAESREKMLAKVDRLDKPQELDADMRLKLTPSHISGKDVLHVEALSKSYQEQALFQNVDLDIRRGEHIALIGENGTGKTTFLKILNDFVSADTGAFRLGSKVSIGYYDQDHNELKKDNTIFDEISDTSPTLTNTAIRNTLAAFLFTGEEVYKTIDTLSGGERGRVSLAKLMLSEANFLILDEPTNHLDIASKEILEQALNAYEGTVLYVSHDRYFINQTATRIVELQSHQFHNYIGNYDYYLEKKAEMSVVPENIPDTKDNSATKDTWQEQKKQQAEKRKRENDLQKTEEQIAKLEERITEIDALLATQEVYTNSVKCQELALEKDGVNEELERLYKDWEALA